MDDVEPDEELERIRERKRERLRQRAARESATGGPSAAASDAAGGRSATPASDAGSTPTEPVQVEDSADFQRAIDAHPLVLVDFYADWCGPCQMLAPTLDRLAATTDVTVAKVDADEQHELTQRFGVRGLPTLLLFVDGEPVEQLVGMQDETTLRAVIDRHRG